MSPREAVAVKKLTRALEAKGYFVHKTHGSRFSSGGWPDLEVCFNARVVFIEVKRDAHHRLTPLQRAVARKLVASYRMPVLVLNGVEDVPRVVEFCGQILFMLCHTPHSLSDTPRFFVPEAE